MTITIQLTDEQVDALADRIAERITPRAADRPLTVREAADRLGVSTSTINRRLAPGTIPTVPGLGRSLIPASVIADLLGGKRPTDPTRSHAR